jgi:hypothetical protein
MLGLNRSYWLGSSSIIDENMIAILVEESHADIDCNHARCAMHRSGSMVLLDRVAGNAMETWILLSFSLVSRY